MMEVSEFRFFELAHERWFGRPASDQLVEAMFDEYLLRESVPPWVRHLAREVLALAGRQALEPERFGLVRPRLTWEKRIGGLFLAAGLGLLLVVFCIAVARYPSF